MSAATLDHLSNGCAVLCLGASTRPLIEKLYGIEFESPVARLQEYISIVRDAWSGE